MREYVEGIPEKSMTRATQRGDRKSACHARARTRVGLEKRHDELKQDLRRIFRELSSKERG